MIIKRIEIGRGESEIEIDVESKSKNGFVFKYVSFPGTGIGVSFFDENGRSITIKESDSHKEGAYTYYATYDN
jgi:hypothetical protein